MREGFDHSLRSPQHLWGREANGSIMKFAVGVIFFLAALGTAAQGQSQIKNVVVIFQENRTPDNLFHGLPGADIANSGLNSMGQTIPLASTSLVTNYDLGHGHANFVEMYDSGKMDGADKINISCAANASGCPPAIAQFKYVNPSEVQ